MNGVMVGAMLKLGDKYKFSVYGNPNAWPFKSKLQSFISCKITNANNFQLGTLLL